MHVCVEIAGAEHSHNKVLVVLQRAPAAGAPVDGAEVAQQVSNVRGQWLIHALQDSPQPQDLRL